MNHMNYPNESQQADSWNPISVVHIVKKFFKG